jgi:hypothetical protein
VKGKMLTQHYLVLSSHTSHSDRSHLFLCSLLLIVLFISIPACDRLKTPPHDLLGIWETDAPKYTNRYIEITNESIIFGLDDGDNIVNTIKYITLEQEGSLFVYTFHYSDPTGETWTLTIIYDPHQAAFALQNRDDVWTKDKP